MDNLKAVILHKDKGYQLNKHYKLYFYLPVTPGHPTEQNKTYQKRLFLTYNGMLKVLFSSRSGIAEHFQEWASRILFTVQMGTVEQKQGLVSTMLGVDIDAFREFLNCGVTPEVSCLYLTTLGYVKDVRDEMDIPKRHKDNAVVCKFGISNNVDQRLMQHKRGFRDIHKADVRVKCFGYIDKMYTSKAETELKHELYDGLLADDEISVRLEYKKHTEIVVLTPLQFKHVTQSVYPTLTKKYGQSVARFTQDIEELRRDLEQQQREHQRELQQQQREHEKELQHLRDRHGLDIQLRVQLERNKSLTIISELKDRLLASYHS